MLVESILKRPGGSTIDLADGTVYRFVPQSSDPTAPHVAFIPNADHLGQLLRISEGFRLAAQQPQTAVAGAAPAITAPVVSAPVTPVAPPAAAPVLTQPPAPERGAAPPADQSAAATTPPEDAPLESLTDDQLRALHASEIGKDARPNASRETIIAKIEANRKAG